MKHKVKVVMLPTEDKTLLVSLQILGKSKLHLCKSILPIEKEERCMPRCGIKNKIK